MKIFLTQILSVAVLCGLSLAQEPAPPQTDNAAPQTSPSDSSALQPATNVRIAPGSVIPVQLTKSIDAKKAKTGDEIEAKVTQDMKTGNGAIVVAKDTKVIGHVTEAQARTKDQKESQVGIAFDRAVMNGSDVKLPMSVQAIIAPPNSNANATAAPSDNSGQPAQTNSNSRTSGMGSSSQSRPSNDATSNETGATTNAEARPPITGSTQGVVGISNLKLAMADNSTQGSVVSSEKNNVKLETGTMMLLKVSQ